MRIRVQAVEESPPISYGCAGQDRATLESKYKFITNQDQSKNQHRTAESC